MMWITGTIPKSQHGFQVGKSTLTATISMFDQWQQAMEREQSTGVLIFDLSAAFDTLDHKILSRKLSSLDFSDQSIMWIDSFMEKRVQHVQVGRTLSSARHIGVGVPQGSCLSPLLFLLYISDIENWIQSASVHGYADDTTLTMSSQDMTPLLEGLEAEAGRVLQYMAVNKLVANPKKTKFLLIRGKKHKKWPQSSINIGNDLVKESSSENILGVTVNNKLKWDEQHSNIVNKLRYKVSMLRRLTFHLPGWVLVKLLDGLVFSAARPERIDQNHNY
jgi:retron-type reverse transcriptase